MPEKIVQLNEEVIKGQLKELVRGSVEEMQKNQPHTLFPIFILSDAVSSHDAA